MQVRRLGSITAFHHRGEHWGFLSDSLELASLSAEHWDALKQPQQHPAQIQDLNDWKKDSKPNGSLNISQKIKTFSLNISQVCNLKCDYCGAGGDGTYGSNVPKVDLKIVRQQLTYFLRQIDAGDAFRFQFLGGEPLLYPKAIAEVARFAQLMVAGRDIALEFGIVTNGTLITPQVAQLMAELKMHVVISLDGPASINDKVRPSKRKDRSSTAWTVQGLKHLRPVASQLGSLQVNAVFGAHNMQIAKCFEFLEQIGFQKYNLSYAVGDQDELYSRLYVEQLEALAERLYAKSGFKGLNQIVQFHQHFVQLHSRKLKHNYCGAGKSLLQSDTKGELHVCNWFMNDKKEAVGFGDQIDHSRLQAYQSSLLELHNCQSCWAKHLCGGGCMSINKTKQGHRHTKDPHFCQRMQGLAALAIHYYAKTLHGGTEDEADEKGQRGQPQGQELCTSSRQETHQVKAGESFRIES